MNLNRGRTPRFGRSTPPYETSRKGYETMSGETTLTVIGNLTNDPELRFNPAGSAVANFTIASTPRIFDSQSSQWKDGETLFLRSTLWREAAENVASSLVKGSRVVATGRLKPRTYETKAGEKRTVIEFEIDEIGLSLRYTSATATGGRKRPSGQEAPPAEEAAAPGEAALQDEAPAAGEAPRIGWRDRLKAQQEGDAAAAGNGGYADDDPWFGKNATGAGYAQPGRTAEPTF